jgi:Rieske Fe-S protein
MRRNNTMKYVISLLILFLVIPLTVNGAEHPYSYVEKEISDIKTGLEINVSELQSGHLLRAKMGKIPVWVYKRTERDISNLQIDNDDRFADPGDKYLDDLIINKYRSVIDKPFAQLLKYTKQHIVFKSYRSINPSYFVFAGMGPHSGCYLTFKPKQFYENTDIVFYDPCTNTKFDSSGRIFQGVVEKYRANEVAKYNLMLLPYHITTQGIISVGLLHGHSELPDIEYDYREEYKKLDPTHMLMLAARMNDRKGIAEALKNGANPRNYKIGDGSVIDSAIIGSATDIVLMLMNLGARPTDSSYEIANSLNRDDVLRLLAAKDGAI